MPSHCLTAVRLGLASCRADGHFSKLVNARYSSYDSVDLSKQSFTKLEAHVLKAGEPKQISGQQEIYENLLNR